MATVGAAPGASTETLRLADALRRGFNPSSNRVGTSSAAAAKKNFLVVDVAAAADCGKGASSASIAAVSVRKEWEGWIMSGR